LRGASEAAREKEIPSSHHVAVAEPEVLKPIGAESGRNGTDRLTLRQIDEIIKTTRAEAAKGGDFCSSAERK